MVAFRRWLRSAPAGPCPCLPAEQGGVLGERGDRMSDHRVVPVRQVTTCRYTSTTAGPMTATLWQPPAAYPPATASWNYSARIHEQPGRPSTGKGASVAHPSLPARGGTIGRMTERGNSLRPVSRQSDFERVVDIRSPFVHGELFAAGHPNRDCTHEWTELAYGDVPGQETLARVHSEFLTSDAFSSLRCGAGEQLSAAPEAVRVAADTVSARRYPARSACQTLIDSRPQRTIAQGRNIAP
ncbi:hypothetical protein EYS09_02120 [Streptomyces kasugaensis]|uniref:GTP cyclohydrolase II domain-containing protein n=1 Tax=Streptomyces kasugaensis TaxID=1946 RepID=A0A4Q9I2S7_STRKA|nr:hypothetical protein EYS09_02120 [Streptomyces kasugaensis]